MRFVTCLPYHINHCTPLRILGASQKAQGYTVVGPSSEPVPTASLFFMLITELALDHEKAIYIGGGL